MRTTVLIDDRLGGAARARAKKLGLSFSAIVSRSLEEHLAKPAVAAKAAPFRLVTVGGGGPRAGVNLDRTSELVVAEDESNHRARGTGR
jgi:hypothetical protein